MANKERKALGTGLSALFGSETLEDENVTTLPLSKIEPRTQQPREVFEEDALQTLAESIARYGVIQPITVRPLSSGFYQIIAGERRWRASKMAGLTKIPAIIRSLDTQNRLELSIIENAQREDLNAIELATAYAKLKTQFNLTAKDIASRVGKSEASVVNTMRLLNLPDDVKKTMVKEKLSEGVMRPLVTMDEAMMRKVLPKIVDEGWTARKVERYVTENKTKSSARLVKSDAYRKDEDILSAKYNAVARVSGRSLTFKCKNEQDLRELILKLQA
jgi:ParB family chromosome partitioning protein